MRQNLRPGVVANSQRQHRPDSTANHETRARQAGRQAGTSSHLVGLEEGGTDIEVLVLALVVHVLKVVIRIKVVLADRKIENTRGRYG